MVAEKLSVSMEASLVKLIRGAASEEGVSLSTWLAEAARAKARHRALHEALHEYGARHGTLTSNEANRLVEAARERSVVSRRHRRKRT